MRRVESSSSSPLCGGCVPRLPSAQAKPTGLCGGGSTRMFCWGQRQGRACASAPLVGRRRPTLPRAFTQELLRYALGCRTPGFVRGGLRPGAKARSGSDQVWESHSLPVARESTEKPQPRVKRGMSVCA